MDYETLLKNAPDHSTNEFLMYLMNNNTVVLFDIPWLVIENTKYHTKEKPHYTAFSIFSHSHPDKYDQEKLTKAFPEFDMLIKGQSRQSVKRFHIHLIKEK